MNNTERFITALDLYFAAKQDLEMSQRGVIGLNPPADIEAAKKEIEQALDACIEQKIKDYFADSM